MSTEWIHEPDDPRLEPFRGIRDRDWLTQRGVFVAEGRAIVAQALSAGKLRVRRLLLCETAHSRLVSELEFGSELRVCVVPEALMRRTSGVSFHQGCVALVELPPAPDSLEGWLRPASVRVLVIEDVTDPDNVGSLFRNAFAFGVDAVLLSPRCASPLYRKSLRTSLGAALRLPFVHATDLAHWARTLDELAQSNVSLVALTPKSGEALPRPLPLPRDRRGAADLPARMALCVGNEGYGLSAGLLRRATFCWRIPMIEAADSVNVATAAAIALARIFEVPRELEAGGAPPDTDL